MIEGYLGEDAFREGVRIYLKRHAEANASADDFWRALDEASGQDVTAIANAWIKEPGHHDAHKANEPTGLLEAGIFTKAGIEITDGKVKWIRLFQELGKFLR